MLLLIVAFMLLFLGLPFFVILFTMSLVIVLSFFPDLNLTILIQQALYGISPVALVAIPMFILAANIITSGDAARKLINVIRVFLGHLNGGLPIVMNVACTLFGSVSGSTQATVAAIGGTMRPMLLEAGYTSEFTFGLMINSSDIAFLIPPSMGFILYGVITQTSIGKLFIAGIIPGLIICFLFSLFSYFYSKYNKNIKLYPASSWKERKQAVKESIMIVGFPIIILGGIYGGIFSPTEAAVSSVLYALVLEGLVYRTLTFKKFIDSVMSTARVMGAISILVAAGQAMSWTISYAGISEAILVPLLGNEPSDLRIFIIMNIAYFIGCMFVDQLVVLYILAPLFAPFIAQAGIDKVFIGVLVVMQMAIGSATPPFGCDIFTTMVIFKRPYFEVMKMTWPFVLILLFVVVLMVTFPELALFLPRHAFGG